LKIYETDIMKAVMQVLNAYNINYTRNNVGAVKVRNNKFYHFGTAGWSDIIACTHKGIFLAIEVKRPGGKLSEKQKLLTYKELLR